MLGNDPSSHPASLVLEEDTLMRTIGNIAWLVFGGLELACWWLVAGLVLCVTVVGIPLGLQCFKFARLTLAPFGRDIRYGGGSPSAIANVLWLVLAGIWMAAAYVIIGAIWCCTIVGIPFGLQVIKMGKLALMPFGAEVVG